VTLTVKMSTSGQSHQKLACISSIRDGVNSHKRRGEIAELGFLYKAASMGFAVTKPYGDSESYDFVVDSGDRFWRGCR
jgi:hypothetical protein